MDDTITRTNVSVESSFSKLELALEVKALASLAEPDPLLHAQVTLCNMLAIALLNCN